MLIAVDNYLEEVNPSLVVVQGDTASALAGALAGFGSGVPVAHVEAGLRSGDLANPWPEEGFRRSIDSLASYLFAPTQRSQEQLRSEQVLGEVFLTGNTVVDALEHIRNSSQFRRLSLEHLLPTQVSEDGNFILFTQHRRESFAFGMRNVLEAIKQIAQDGMPIVMPIHPNPNVVKQVSEHLENHPNVYLIPPQNYLTFLKLLESCRAVVSDSGGVQEEAPSFGKRVVITRHTTERPEVLHSGYGVLCGFDTKRIVQEVQRAWDSPQEVKRGNPFGDGQASARIVEIISRALKS
jgi:UDP-N-acetylglucosamine 2-epimerase (non-hydrolysing)